MEPKRKTAEKQPRKNLGSTCTITASTNAPSGCQRCIELTIENEELKRELARAREQSKAIYTVSHYLIYKTNLRPIALKLILV